MSPEELAAIRARHHPAEDYPRWCAGCGEKVPCEVGELLEHIGSCHTALANLLPHVRVDDGPRGSEPRMWLRIARALIGEGE